MPLLHKEGVGRLAFAFQNVVLTTLTGISLQTLRKGRTAPALLVSFRSIFSYLFELSLSGAFLTPLKTSFYREGG
jgi:hypothetical protein